MALPVSQYSVLDARRIERLGENRFRCFVDGVRLFSFSVEPVVDVEVDGAEKTKAQPPKKATPLGDLIALISPARKREAGGPPPPTLSKRLRAIRGSLRAVVAHAWQRTL